MSDHALTHIGVGFGGPICGADEWDDPTWAATVTAGAVEDQRRSPVAHLDRWCDACLAIYERDDLAHTPPLVVHSFEMPKS